MRSARLAIFFLALGLGEVLHWGRLEPAFEGNRRRGFWLVSPAEGAGALAPARLSHCMRALEWTETRSLLHSPHNHHHQVSRLER